MSRVTKISLLAGVAITLGTASGVHATYDRREAEPNPAEMKDKKLITVVVEVGPFLINSLYLSGEGPGRIRDISVEELIANQKTTWVEATEGMSKELAALNEDNPSFKAANPPGTQFLPVHEEIHQAPIDPTTTKDVLYWVRGAKLEIIDENGKTLDRPEFLCHSLIRLDEAKHADYFSRSSVIYPGILFNFSQGTTHHYFPKDFGLPVNSHERLRFEYKSLNRTSDRTRHIKCRWTMYLLADKDARRPVHPLDVSHSGIDVVLGGENDPNRAMGQGCGMKCALHQTGKDASNDMLHRKLNAPFLRNKDGKEITQHWAVPPGRHSWRTLHPEIRFDDQGEIIAAGAHVHPFCESMSLIEDRPGFPEKKVFTIYSQTDTSHGFQIANIDYLTWPKSGIRLDGNATYGWEVVYNNTSGVDQDAMAFITLYVSNPHFQKPAWAL